LRGGVKTPTLRAFDGLRKLNGPIAGAPSLASFAPLRLCENRRPNEEANLAQRRKAAKAGSFISQRQSNARIEYSSPAYVEWVSGGRKMLQ
jgi:hypothetical protein